MGRKATGVAAKTTKYAVLVSRSVRSFDIDVKKLSPSPHALRLAGGLLILLGAIAFGQDKSLVVNGTFDDKDEPFKGWITDYAFSGNKYYIENKERVKIVASEGDRTSVVSIKPAGDAGAKMESKPIVFEAGYRYTCTLDIKGGPYRIYFAGYKWEPGIRPHDDPELGELRMIYKSKAASSGGGPSWKAEKLELPGVKLSPQAKTHLKAVRFVTVYVWMMKEGFVDNIVVERTADPSVEF